MNAPQAIERIISADDHMDLNVLPPTLWQDRLPASLRERAPRVVETDDGAVWQSEDGVMGLSGRRGSGLLRSEDHGFRPGDPKTRLEDMDRDGVYTHVIYGPPAGLRLSDAKLEAACLAAYNDWAAEFNAADPNRLVVLALISGLDPDAATAELRRVAAAGHKGVLLYSWDSHEPVFEAPWEPFWTAAEETNTIVNVHLGGGLHSLRGAPRSWRMPAMVSVVPMQLDEVLAGLVFSGVLERHPGVRVVLGESGLGWIPYVLDRMDHEYKKYYDLTEDFRLELTPREYFQRQVYATYEEDDLGLELIDRIGAGNVMWASDYPHGDSTWPNSRQAIDDSPLGRLADADRRKIIHDNAAELYVIT